MFLSSYHFLAADEYVADLYLLVEHNEIRVCACRNASLIQPHEGGGYARHHVYRIGKVKAALVPHHADETVCRGDASRKGGAVGELTHPVLHDEGRAALELTARLLRGGDVQTVCDQRDLVLALDLYDHTNQLGGQVLAVCDDLYEQLVPQKGAFNDAQRTEAVISRHGGGTGVEVGDKPHPLVDGHPHILVGGVGVSRRGEDAVGMQVGREHAVGVVLGGVRPAGNVPAVLRDQRLILLRDGRGDVGGALGSALLCREVGALQMGTEQMAPDLPATLGGGNVRKGLLHDPEGGGHDGGEDGGGAVGQMDVTARYHLLGGGVGKAVASRAVGVEVDEAGGNVLSRVVIGHAAVGGLVGDGDDLSVLHGHVSRKYAFGS